MMKTLLTRTFRPIVILLLWALPLSAWAQVVDFTPLLNARSVVALWDSGQRIFGGLDEGGLVIWEDGMMSTPTRISAGMGLSGNQVSDLAWSGRYLWVATRDGGLTRIADPDGEMSFRQYSSNLGDLQLTAVTGTLVGESERVFYAMDGAGIGRIVDGLPGALYTAEQDGLIDNNVNALQFLDGELFVGTPSGISRFANNVFTDMNDGLSNVVIKDFCLDSDGNLLAGGNGGVFRWDPVGEIWTYIGGTGTWVLEVASGPAGTYALGVGNGGVGILAEYDGSSWTNRGLPFNLTYALAAEHDLLVGGRVRPATMSAAVGFGWLGRDNGSGGFDVFQVEASLVRNATGVTFGTDGTPWIGSHNADAISNLQPDGWSSIYELASADNDSSGLFNFGSNVLSMTTGTDGIVYGAQYTVGVVRWDPEAGRSHLMYPSNCGLMGGNIVNMATHPEGPIFFMHDWANPNKVEVLVDPDHWRNPDSWLILPVGDGGLGNGSTVWDALVQRNDVIWFAVEGTGLVRWDINGDVLGPDDPLTWLDTTDDRWDAPVADFPGTTNDPLAAVALVNGPDGTIWVGGNGLTRFRYGEFFPYAVTVVEQFNQKTSPFAEGLIDGNIEDLALDRNGHLWISTRAGLNRGITSGGETSFDAWFDLGNYLSNSSYGTLYSPDSIVSLPGGLYRRIVADPQGEKLLLSSDRGAVLLEPGQGGGDTPPGALGTAYVYPNPFKPDEGEGRLKVGGIPADAVNGVGAMVQVYNVEGQVVFDSEDASVTADEGFWDGRNISIERNDVTTGMYLVRVTYEGKTTVLPLAILR